MVILRKPLLLLFILFIGHLTSAQVIDTASLEISSDFKFRAIAEIGFLSVINHKVQFSNNGTYFDYKKDGGQDVLFPVRRFSLELQVNKRNTFFLLYQPLRLESQVLLEDDLSVDDQVFPATSSVRLLYNFPYYRFSYLRELVKNNDSFKFAIGGSLQIRNATISFESGDGTLYRTNRDVGLVPAFKVRSRKQFKRSVFVELEADGIYAPISYLNGSDNEVVGAILDASLRTGMGVTQSTNTFLNIRYLGGGAVGTSDDDSGPGDGYVRNWLHFITVSAGFIYEW